MIEDKLSIITPVRLGHPQDLINCIMSLTSLYVVLGPNRPTHMISPCDYGGLPLGPRLTQKFKDMLINNFKPDYEKARKCLEQMGANWTEVAPMSTPVQALVSCLQNVSTEYTYIHLADVGFINGKNVFEPICKMMDRYPKLCQVRIGGYPFSNQKKNTDIVKFGGEFDKYLKDDDKHLLENHPIETGESNLDSIWFISMKAEYQQNFFPVPLWNCIMRTSFLKKVVQLAIELSSTEPKTLTDLVKVINGATDLVEYNLYSVGWREEFKWIEDLDQGILNMACYQYAWGREENPPAWFAKNNTIEVL
jgi:hypothetical protein